MVKKRKFYTRKWLNNKNNQSTAFIFAYIDDEGYCEFKVSDCTKIVELSLEWPKSRDRESVRNTINKLQTIINETSNFLNAYKKEAGIK